MKRSASEIVEQMILYFMIFLILREWLIPIMTLTDTGYYSLFLIFMVICLMLGIMKWRIFITWPIKIAYIMWFLVSVYHDGTSSAYAFLSNELNYNVEVLLAGDFILVSDPFRTGLFFVLIWMLIYLIQHWVTVRLTIYYFLVLTVFFIATLDTLTEYDGKQAIIKVLILGLIMTAMLFIKRLMQATNMQKDWMSYIVYVIPVAVLVIVVGVLAAILPKAEAQWSDPVPYFKNMNGPGGSGNGKSVGTVGYGDNDETLGGPFVGDDTVVYEMKTPIRQYWRVETKDTYTSKGWVSTKKEDYEFIISTSDETTEFPLSIKPGTGEVQQVDVHSFTEKNFLLQAYGVVHYRFDDMVNQISFSALHERIKPVMNGNELPVESYHLVYQEPDYSFTQLKESTTSTESDPRYLQLPKQLPQRVVGLAHQITDSHDTVYDKARAIEDYFKRSGFKYETENVQVPAEDEDYVDQFLFETKLGYCDNFSTSMVVLLRSVGIQARWVKGFASGERISSEDGMHTYIVTNNDAHSWVEAYIDGIGWMPFEPTIGFSNPMNIDYDMDVSDLQEEQLPEIEQQQMERQQLEEKEQQIAASTSKSIDFSKYMWVLSVIVIVLLIVAFVVWKKRGKWQPKLILQMNRSKLKNVSSFEDGYLVLLKQLERIYLKRRTDETLQQFAMRVDKQLETTKMSELTAIYEQIIYAGITQNFAGEKVKEIWEYLINRTSS
jgi:transglutaminase-like putative cysteine protease